jgi:hypothetical protein
MGIIIAVCICSSLTGKENDRAFFHSKMGSCIGYTVFNVY